MPPDTGAARTVALCHSAAAAARPLRVADVAIFYGERGGGIRTYLRAKAEFALRTGAFEHHLVIPGRSRADEASGRHEQRSLQLAASNGYRLPLGSTGLQSTLRSLAPDIVLLHDPFWTPRLASPTAHDIGATVVAVHHSSAALHAAGLPGPHGVYTKALRRWYRRAYLEVDAIMSVVDPVIDTCQASTLRLRLGLDPAFTPHPKIAPGRHVLYVGRLSREKGLRTLLEAAATAREPWSLVLLGTGPARDTLRERARQLGLGDRVRFEPYVADRQELALAYAGASCVVLPGAHETFGLVALEAAACAARVVTAHTTPSAALLDGFIDTFQPGNSADLLRAIERARVRVPDPGTAVVLGARHSWNTALAAELADLERLVSGL